MLAYVYTRPLLNVGKALKWRGLLGDACAMGRDKALRNNIKYAPARACSYVLGRALAQSVASTSLTP